MSLGLGLWLGSGLGLELTWIRVKVNVWLRARDGFVHVRINDQAGVGDKDWS